MGSDKSNFNAESLIVWGEVTRKCPLTTTFEEKGEPKLGFEPTPSAYQPNISALGHTGSLGPK